MTLGEIKIESLKLMYTNLDSDINADMIDIYLNDDNYRGYLLGMTGSINRCFGRIEERKVLPSKTKRFVADEGTVSSKYIRYDLDAITDLYCVDRVVYESANEYVPDYDYMTEGNTLVLDRISNDGAYTLIYKPSIKRVYSGDSNDDIIEIPDSIAAIIPYYVKGDLFRDDEPNEASESRNWFEQALDEIAQKPTSKSNTVKTVFNQTEW